MYKDIRNKLNKIELIKEVINSMKGDIYNYEEVIFDLAEEGLKKWDMKELKNFLGIGEEN